MKVENFIKQTDVVKTRVSATVTWENCDRPQEEVFFETTAEFVEDLVINPDTWLLACTLPAMRYGEDRIAINASISPEIKDGLINAMRCLIDWHGGATPRRLKAQGNAHLSNRKVIKIEAPRRTQPLLADRSNRAAGFFSGGINALAMVQDNHLNFSPDHPRHIKDGILIDEISEKDISNNYYQNIVDAVSAIAKDAEVELIPVSTNAYAHFHDLDPEYSFWNREYIGSFLAAIAHAFAPRFSCVSIASTHDYPNLEPWGSHPLLDPLYSSSGLQIRHENAALSRLDKTKLVGKWDVALKHLQVCNEKKSYKNGNYNCGRCNKCLKTMMAFLALGLLEQIPAFAPTNISQEFLLENCQIGSAYDESCYRELIEPLSKINRQDLVNGIEKIIKSYHRQDLIDFIEKIDKSLLGNNLLNLINKNK